MVKVCKLNYQFIHITPQLCMLQNVKKHLVVLSKDKLFKTYLTEKNINRICSSISSAIRLRQPTNNHKQLAKDFMNIPHHVLGIHLNCADDFCQSKELNRTFPRSTASFTTNVLRLVSADDIENQSPPPAELFTKTAVSVHMAGQ